MKNNLLISKAASLAIAAIITYQLLLILLLFLRPDLDPSWHTISEWAIGPYGWVMTGAFFVSAISYLSLFIALKPYIDRGIGYIGWLLLLICVIGTIGVGMFTTDPLGTPGPKVSTTGLLHIVTGSTALVLFPFASMLINIGLSRKSNLKLSAGRMRLWTAFIPLTGFVAFVLYTALFVAPLGPRAYGPGVHIGWPPRVAFFTYMVWIVIAASFCRKGLRNIVEK